MAVTYVAKEVNIGTKAKLIVTDGRLPDLTEEDNGKILKAKDGFYVLVEDTDESSGCVFNVSTHYDFPSIGDPNVIYKAESEKAIYQWNPTTMVYEQISASSTDLSSATVLDGGNARGHEGETDEINYINGGNAYGTD